MKITLWQQFSANHSSSFTIVGTFSSIDEAQKAETIFREMFDSILEWQEYERNNRYADIVNPNAPTFPETEYAAKYDLDWNEHVDWIDGKNIFRVENHLFIADDSIPTWQSPDLMLDLMGRFTDVVNHSRSNVPERTLLVTLSCMASDVAVATALYTILDSYFKSLEETDGDLITPPWIDFDEESRFNNEENLQKQVILDHIEKIESGTIDYATLGSTLIPKEEYVKNLRQSLSHTWINDQSCCIGGKVEHDGLAINFPALYFCDSHKGLPVFIRYLEAQGCTQIQYRFFDIPYEEIDQYFSMKYL